MNKNNIKVAKELIKLARILIARYNIANKDGQYKNFTGQIDWNEINGEVKNAHFILKDGQIHWISGIWNNGFWNDGIWESGIWKNGTWINGEWNSGSWINGIWNDGIWKKGYWFCGFDKDRNKHQKNDTPDQW